MSNQINIGGGNVTGGNIKISGNRIGGDHRNITTQNYIEGNISGGNIAGRDIVNIQNNQSMSKNEFLDLLQRFKQDLSQSSLPKDDLEAIEDDIANVEKQLHKEAPKKSLISRKLNSINGILDDANNAMDTAEKSNKLRVKIIKTAQLLMSGLGFLN